MMIETMYRRLPGPGFVRVIAMIFVALLILIAVIWSYELLGDLLDSGGTVGT